MFRSIAFIALCVPATVCMAMQQSAPPIPKVETPNGWPLIGYGLAAVLLLAAVFISMKAANREDTEESGVKIP